MAILTEKDGQRQLKNVNLRTDKISTHYFDSAGEVSPANGEISEFFDVSLEDNFTFNSNSVRYRLSTPSTPQRVLDYQMSIKKPTSVLFEDQIKNFKRDTLICERVMMSMRDGLEIPVVMVYDRRYYTEESPWVMFTRGVESEKDDLSFHEMNLSLTDRGIVLAFPLIRGKFLFSILCG